jgi:hypothetical protein
LHSQFQVCDLFHYELIIDVEVPLLTITEDVSSLMNMNDQIRFYNEKTLAARNYLRNKALKILN